MRLLTVKDKLLNQFHTTLNPTVLRVADEPGQPRDYRVRGPETRASGLILPRNTAIRPKPVLDGSVHRDNRDDTVKRHERLP